MESSSTSQPLGTPISHMTLSKRFPIASLVSFSGSVYHLDLKSLKMRSQSQIFKSKINSMKNIEGEEILACTEKGDIFYGNLAQGNRQGIEIKHKREVFDVDIAEFIVALGSCEGEIGK